MAKKVEAAQDLLVGKWFHSFEDGQLVSQGRILGRIKAGVYLAQLYCWRQGTPVHKVVVSAEKMQGWRFYASPEEITQTYANHWRQWLDGIAQ
jgi:hypothetical protein